MNKFLLQFFLLLIINYDIAYCEPYNLITLNNRYSVSFPDIPKKYNTHSVNATMESYMLANKEGEGGCLYVFSVSYSDTLRKIFLDKDKKFVLENSLIEFAKNMNVRDVDIKKQFSVMTGVGSVLSYSFPYKKDGIDVFVKGFKLFDYNKQIDLHTSCTSEISNNTNIDKFLYSFSIINDENSPATLYIYDGLKGLEYTKFESKMPVIKEFAEPIESSGGIHIDLNQFYIDDNYNKVTKAIDMNLRNMNHIKNKEWRKSNIEGYAINDFIEGMGFIWYIFPSNLYYNDDVFKNGTIVFVQSVN